MPSASAPATTAPVRSSIRSHSVVSETHTASDSSRQGTIQNSPRETDCGDWSQIDPKNQSAWSRSPLGAEHAQASSFGVLAPRREESRAEQSRTASRRAESREQRAEQSTDSRAAESRAATEGERERGRERGRPERQSSLRTDSEGPLRAASGAEGVWRCADRMEAETGRFN